MPDIATHFGAAERAGMFEALELAATRAGLALFVVHISTSPPTVVYASELLADFVGRPVRDLVGRPPWELVTPPQQDRVRDIIASRGPGSPAITLHFDIDRPSGGRRNVEVGVVRVTTAGQELSVCYFRDVTDRRVAAEALRRSEARFRSLIENAPEGVAILQDGRYVLANPAVVKMLGIASVDEIEGRLLSEFLPPTETARAMERIADIRAGSPPRTAEYRLLRNDLWVEVLSIPYEYENKPAILTFIRDATERRRMQQQLFRADRLNALGTMAATVAHEVNNPLTYLQLNLQRLELELASDADPARAARLRELVTNAQHGAERVARIVRDLRAQSRDTADETEGPVDVVAVVERALEMVDHDVRHRAQLVRRYPAAPAVVDGFAGRLEQVVINILVNALQSLEGTDHAKNQVTIEISTGDHVTIAVSDTGRGISDPTRVFEPFFTTKPSGEGTGLGLSICKQIVESMRGRIEIASGLDKGTTVTVSLPARRAAPVPQPTSPASSDESTRLRILLVDDEDFVRQVLSSLLATEHDVTSVATGEAALAKIAEARFDVILCDVMMPRVNGRDVYERVRAQWPGLERRIVFMTGGAFVPSLAAFVDAVDNLKLHKPFTIEDALAILHEAHRR